MGGLGHVPVQFHGERSHLEAEPALSVAALLRADQQACGS